MPATLSRSARRPLAPVVPLVATGVLAVALAACGSSTPTASHHSSGTTTTISPATTAPGAGASLSTTSAPSRSSGTGTGGAPSAPGGALGGSSDTHTPGAQLTGAGANSIYPFFQSAFYHFGQADSAVSVDYSPAGSSVGVSDIQQGTVDFGDSEIPMTAGQLAKAGGAILQVPVDLGGVALSYDIPGVKGGLKLDGPTLAGIYLGSITNWDDGKIAALNPGVSLPNLQIVPVHRADSSGPGYDLDQYLIDTSPAWVSAIGTSTASSSWPKANVGVGQQLNTGVANYIQQTPGAIGYVEYAYALEASFSNVALSNAAGNFVTPSQSTIAAAGANARNLSAANFNIVNGSGADTYPLANFSWTLLYQKQASANKGIVLGKLFDWVTTTGQQYAAAIGYSPLPANVVSLAHQTLLQLETGSGQPLFSS